MCDNVIGKSGSFPERRYRCRTLIVGAGLAGASLGFLLRKAGDDVLLLELLDAKEKDKLCGGMTNATGVDEFEKIFGTNSFGANISRRRFLRGNDAPPCGDRDPTCERREKITVPYKSHDHEAWKYNIEDYNMAL